MKKVIIVTGGCQGLGKEIAKTLGEENSLIILSKDEAELRSVSCEIGCDNIPCDISDVSAVKSAVKFVTDKYGKIDALINNAGVWRGGELDDTGYEDIARLMLINSVGTMNMTKAVLPTMKKQKSGSIINIVSVDGLEGKDDRSVYGASKWAITGFTESLRKELEKYNIFVTGIYPGLMKTNLFKNAGADRDFTNAMEPKDVAKVVQFILTFENSCIEKIVIRGLHS
jgi:NADP-dependent 3-hydroxy acid dehydrogenase YdfG